MDSRGTHIPEFNDNSGHEYSEIRGGIQITSDSMDPAQSWQRGKVETVKWRLKESAC